MPATRSSQPSADFWFKAGDQIVSNVRLHDTDMATSVQFGERGLVIADAPFAETNEQIDRVVIVDCSDLDAAIDLAAEVAHIGTVEIRPVQES
jgi:hypothetical protein